MKKFIVIIEVVSIDGENEKVCLSVKGKSADAVRTKLEEDSEPIFDAVDEYFGVMSDDDPEESYDPDSVAIADVVEEK